MNNADYWRDRAAILAKAAHDKADRVTERLDELYMEAQRNVQKEIEAWYGRYAASAAANNGISITEARKLLTSRELEELRWNVDQYIKAGQLHGLDPVWMKKLENASARFHISRLESVQLGIQQQIELLYGGQTDALDELLRGVVGSSYTRTAFDLQYGLGVAWDITKIDQTKLDALLSKPWTTDGRTFRDRCWAMRDELVNSVQKNLMQGIMRGEQPRKMTDAIAHQFGVSKYKAGRLVHTETTYFNAVASQQSYRELHVESVEIIETLDSSTCEICGGLDGKVIPMSEYKPGITVPPFHPNCRGTTAPTIDSKYMGERAARGDDGEVYYVPANMTYEEWEKAFVGGGDKSGLVKVNDSFEDITDSWFADKTPNSDPVRELGVYVHKGKPYNVDGRNVVQDHDAHEKEIADMLSSTIGGKVYMVPRVNYPQGISTPDFIFNGYAYDLKTIKTGTSRNTIYNRLKKASGQSRRFIVDITGYPYSASDVVEQVNKIFWSKETRFVDEVVIVKEMKVVSVFRRK